MAPSKLNEVAKQTQALPANCWASNAARVCALTKWPQRDGWRDTLAIMTGNGIGGQIHARVVALHVRGSYPVGYSRGAMLCARFPGSSGACLARDRATQRNAQAVYRLIARPSAEMRSEPFRNNRTIS